MTSCSLRHSAATWRRRVRRSTEAPSSSAKWRCDSLAACAPQLGPATHGSQLHTSAAGARHVPIDGILSGATTHAGKDIEAARGSGLGRFAACCLVCAEAQRCPWRSLIVLVKKTLETRFLLRGTALVCLDTAAETEAAGGKPLKVLYGDTDSVMILMPGCSLQEAAAHGKAISVYFGEFKLKAPHVLAFEKVLWPVAFYKKKMYAAAWAVVTTSCRPTFACRPRTTTLR